MSNLSTEQTTKERDVILAALAILEKRGWTPDSSTCVALAIEEAANNSELGEATRRLFAAAIGLTNGTCSCIGRWNDQPFLTFPEVKAALLKAAA